MSLLSLISCLLFISLCGYSSGQLEGSGFTPPEISSSSNSPTTTTIITSSTQSPAEKERIFLDKLKEFCLRKPAIGGPISKLLGQRNFIRDPFHNERFYICTFEFSTFRWVPQVFQCPAPKLFCERVQSCVSQTQFDAQTCKLIQPGGAANSASASGRASAVADSATPQSPNSAPQPPTTPSSASIDLNAKKLKLQRFLEQKRKEQEQWIQAANVNQNRIDTAAANKESFSRIKRQLPPEGNDIINEGGGNIEVEKSKANSDDFLDRDVFEPELIDLNEELNFD